jgi:hypothetical protein
MKTDIGKMAPRPPHWVMYTVKPMPPPYTFGDMYTGGYVAPTVVVNCRGGAFADACFYAPLTTTQT